MGACLPLRAAVAPNSEVQKPFGVVGVFDLGVEAVRVGGVMVVVQPICLGPSLWVGQRVETWRRRRGDGSAADGYSLGGFGRGGEGGARRRSFERANVHGRAVEMD